VRESAPSDERGAPGAAAVFLAVLGPMSTVPALRRLLLDVHGGSPALLQCFVAIGMLGAVLGAPVLARRADARGDHLQLATKLALLDAAVAALTPSSLPTALLFLLRPIHGAASMGILALLFARFRGSRGELVSQAGSAAIVALALGPALGGMLTKLGPAAPFRFAAALSLLLAVLLALRSKSAAPAPVARGPAAKTEVSFALARPLAAPLLLVASQRFAIGGLVAALAVHLRVKHGFSDSRVGACFSIFLVVFALGTWWSGRTQATLRSAARIGPGALLFAVAFASFGFASPHALMAALALAGLGASLVYAPCLALVADRAPNGARATAMALFHAAGGLGMLLGPLGALAIDYTLRASAPELRTAAFMFFAGSLHALAALYLSPRLRRLASVTAPSPRQSATFGVDVSARRPA
jgi:MFS transporter, DHA1 family, tetracycline resistance protein